MTTQTDKPRKATIQRRPVESNNWLVVFTNSSGGETYIDTGMVASEDHYPSGIVVLPIRDWALRFNVEFPLWSARDRDMLNYTIRTDRVAEFRESMLECAKRLKETLPPSSKSNAECEECGERFYIRGIEDLPENTQLRHTETHGSEDGGALIISDGEKVRREAAEKQRRPDEFDTMHLVMHVPPGLTLSGQRRHVNMVVAAISDGRITLLT